MREQRELTGSPRLQNTVSELWRQVRQLARRRRLSNQRGQALVEMAFVIVLLVTLTIGVMELGRAWMILNMITQAARDGARAGAVTPLSNRDPSTGLIVDSTGIKSLVMGQLGAVLAPATVADFTVSVTQPTVSSINVVTVTVNGTVPYIFNLIGDEFIVGRSMTFRDEGR